VTAHPARKLQQLRALIELSSLINSTLNTGDIRTRATEAAMTLTDAEAGSILLIDRETEDLFFEVALGERGDMIKEIRLAKGQGIAGWVAEKGEPLIINDAQSDARFFDGADRISSFITRNMICVPVKAKGKVIGVLQTINKKEGIFDAEDRDILSVLANQVAVAIENASLYHDLRETFYETAKALAETIEKRDPYTGGHTQRVMNYSVSTGKMMGLPPEMIESLKLAAILHDIGKIGVRDNILLKNGKLDSDEMMKMNRHTEFGAEILGHVKQLKNVVPGVRGHHEKYDGSGYPDNLKGPHIPLIARIIAVADTFDAMTTDRPYRKAVSASRAIEELRKMAGTQFDGNVVEKFVDSIEGTGKTNAA